MDCTDARVKTLITQEYIRDETLNLRRELLRAQEEVKRIQSVPLVIGQFLEAVDERRALVGSTTGELSSSITCSALMSALFSLCDIKC